MTKDQALKRVAHICNVKNIPLDGFAAVGLADFVVKHGDKALLRAAKVAKVKRVEVNGSALLQMAQFLV